MWTSLEGDSRHNEVHVERPREGVLALHDKEGEDQCVWIRVKDGARSFILSSNRYFLGAYSILGTGNTKGVNTPNILCPYLVYIPLRKTGKQGDTYLDSEQC